MKIIGYIRASSVHRERSLQERELKRAGCEQLFADTGRSSTGGARPELAKCLAQLEAGDLLIIWKQDRLGRSLTDLIRILLGLAARGVAFRSISDNIDTRTSSGRTFLRLIRALSECDFSLKSEGARSGLAAAKERGIRPGPCFSLDARKVHYARELIGGGQSRPAVAALLRVSRATLYRALARHP